MGLLKVQHDECIIDHQLFALCSCTACTLWTICLISGYNNYSCLHCVRVLRVHYGPYACLISGYSNYSYQSSVTEMIGKLRKLSKLRRLKARLLSFYKIQFNLVTDALSIFRGGGGGGNKRKFLPNQSRPLWKSGSIKINTLAM